MSYLSTTTYLNNSKNIYISISLYIVAHIFKEIKRGEKMSRQVIKSNDPEAIVKLQEKLKKLTKIKKELKNVEHTTAEMNYITAKIRQVKLRIEALENVNI